MTFGNSTVSIGVGGVADANGVKGMFLPLNSLQSNWTDDCSETQKFSARTVIYKKQLGLLLLDLKQGRGQSELCELRGAGRACAAY